MADDKDKQKYSYRPNIEYQDTYESDHDHRSYQTVYPDDKKDDDVSQEIMQQITNSFNEVSKIIPLLPAKLQTSINNVYKPILDSWATVRKNGYPKVIPDTDAVIIKIPEPLPGPEPYPPKYIYPYPPDIPEPTPSSGGGGEPFINNDGIWDIDTPMVVDYPDVDPVEVIEKEYIKNIADLFNYYVNRLKDILYHYYSEKIAATFAKKIDSGGNFTNKTMPEIAFMFSPITDCCSDVEEGMKHLFDASVSMSERSRLKMDFMGNAFPVEQTLFHLKNFKAIYALRLRYAKIDAIDGSNKLNAVSNNILKGMKASYNQKYDVAFANLYKYMNSSLDILEDVVNTELAGLRARRTLIEKGGIKK